MKIDEPKTPYAKHYEPEEDEEEFRAIDAHDLNVDELDKVEGNPSHQKSRGTREDRIPGLELGEPEEAVDDSVPAEESGRIVRSASQKEKDKGEKAVVVDQTDAARHDSDSIGLNREEREKHKQFEEMRKKHYEMSNVRGMLG